MEESKNFELLVVDLLSVAGYDVHGEKLCGHKKIDLYFERKDLGNLKRVAGECKFYQKQLTQAQVNQIYSNYLPLYRDNKIDEIIIITKNGLSPSAIKMVETTRELAHVSFEELQRSLMEFSYYLQSQIDQYYEDGLNEYYVPLSAAETFDLEQHILHWIDNPKDQKPIAILGSYGLGKTTFARRLVYVLSKKANEKINARIPILIKLGQIASEQSLEGLLGKSFTAENFIRNYSFQTFMVLNKIGRFVIILDGFDEMKHSLTWEQFKYNFKQLNRLINEKSKVIILGRPTAFMNEFEFNYALHGIRHFGNQEIRDPDWPDFKELSLLRFNGKQVERFLYNFYQYKISILESILTNSGTSKKEKKALITDERKLKNIIRTQIEKISSKQLSDIARRPVQLKMLAEILPQWKGDVTKITTAILYSEFIDLIIERELDKYSRLRFGKKERRTFARKLSWWLWNSKKEMNVTAEDIPESLIIDISGNSQKVEIDRRDLVMACFLESKAGGPLYFPHRSFQEFLVAEEIVNILNSDVDSIEKVIVNITNEISDFLAGLINIETLKQWDPKIRNYFGTLPWNFVRIFISNRDYANYILERAENSNNGWYALLGSLIINRFDKNISNIEPETIYLNELRESIIALEEQKGIQNSDHSKSLSKVLLNLLCLFILTEKMDNRDNLILQSIQSMMYRKVSFKNFFSKINISKRKHTLDFRGIYSYLRVHLENYALISDWVVGETIKTDIIEMPSIVYIKDNDLLDKIIKYKTEHKSEYS